MKKCPGEEKSMRILIADDDPVARCFLEDRLKEWGYEVSLATNGQSARDLLVRSVAPTLAIIDWMMPGCDGCQICREVRNRPPGNYVYILMLTAKGHEDDILKAFEAGADDYLVKPFEPLELKGRLLAGQRILDLHTALVVAREDMRHLAMHDALTGLCNRRALLEALERELFRGHREGRPIGVIMCDLDHFKDVNDTYGHAAGDTVLREATRRMASSLRPYDLMGRFGGEEFLIIQPGGDANSAANLAERLRQAVAAEPIAHQDHPIATSISLGVAVAGGGDSIDVGEILQQADRALYRAKESGRNRVELYQDAAAPLCRSQV
jgi:diguanylate cyclase (GGDEF)-like protein